MKTSLVFIAGLLLLVANVYSQNIKEADWIASIEQEVRNIHRTQLNVPLIETKSNNLFALEPTTGEILWKKPLAQPIQYINSIDGTPYSLIDSVMLVNVNTGQSIDLNSMIKGDLSEYYLIPESYDLVFYSRGPDYFLVVDLFEFQVRWNMRADFSDKPGQTAKSKFAGAFAQVKDASNQSVMLGLECPPISNKTGGLIIAGFGKLTNVDDKGKVIWQVEQPKKKKGGLIKTVDNETELLIDDTRDQFYMLKSKMMTAVKISDGTQVWPEFYEVKGDVILDAGKGLMPMSIYQEKNANGSGGSGGMFSKSRLNLVDHATGKALWPVELELKGFVDRYQVLNNGDVAIITYNQTNSKFQVIDVAQGKFRYAEEIKLKGRVNEFVVGKDKALFATSKGIDVIDLNTGGDLLPKMQKFENDADIFTVYKGQYVYNIDAKNTKVYKTDLLTDVSSVIIRDFKFQAGEKLVKYDVQENGNLFLASDHHMLLFSPSGESLIDKPFDYKGRGLDRFSNTMDQIDKVTSTIGMIASIATSAAVLGIGTQIGMGSEAAQMSYDLVAPELAIHNLARNERAAKYYLSLKRLDKDLSASGAFFVRRDKTLKADFLSYVSKSTGEVVFDIPLAEDAKNPEFSINEATGFVYYSPQFVNQENAPYQAMFNKEKLKKAEENNRLGFVAGYQF